MGRGRGQLNEREERVDERSSVRDACELGKAEALGETLKEQGARRGKKRTSMRCMNGRDEGASACCSVSDDCHRLNATTVAAEVCLKLAADRNLLLHDVAEQGDTHICFCEIGIKAEEDDVGTWFARNESFLAICPVSATPLVVTFNRIVLGVALAVGRVVCAVVIAVIIALGCIVTLQQASSEHSLYSCCVCVHRY